ncbi:MAG: NHL repeat-containing protein [Gaiellaceae bacterium]
MYISDKGRGIVDRFDLNGKFLNVVGHAGRDKGGIGTPGGLFVSPGNVQPTNPDGPPPVCSPDARRSERLWVADESAGRISIFNPDGTWAGGWCSSPASEQPGGCTVRRGSGATGGFPSRPTDVWVTSDAVFAPFGSIIRQFNVNGEYVRDSGSLREPVSVAVSGGQLWAPEHQISKLALLSVGSGRGVMPLVREFGSGKYDGKTAGSFAAPRAVATAPNGTVYVLDSTRVQVLSPSGRYLSAITLPDYFGGPSDVAVRYDGTVYITGADSPGALVYSPGPIVSLHVRQVGSQRIQLTGSVRPANAGASIELQQFEKGFRTIVRLRLDRKSAFRFVWTAPSTHATYALRAFFRDRASRLEQLVLK